jgi:hypothetical protein
MIEDIDYSEEAKYDFLESIKIKENLDWAKCIISQMTASFDDINKKLKEKKITITKKQYDKICKELGIKFYS